MINNLVLNSKIQIGSLCFFIINILNVINKYFCILCVQQTQQEPVGEVVDVSTGFYGQMDMIQSAKKFEDREFKAIKDLDKKLESQVVWLRGRLHTSRAKGINDLFPFYSLVIE